MVNVRKMNSLIRRMKSYDILRYTFRITIRYKFFVYCDILIYCDTPANNSLVPLDNGIVIFARFRLYFLDNIHNFTIHNLQILVNYIHVSKL